jgi:hypothetical protein
MPDAVMVFAKFIDYDAARLDDAVKNSHLTPRAEVFRPSLWRRGPISHQEYNRLELLRLERTVQHHLMGKDSADE